MTLTVTLPESTVEVVAGGSVPVQVVVANRGPSPVRVDLELTGRAAPWLDLGPDPGGSAPDGTIAPGETRTAELVLAPPRGAAVPGQLVPFRVRAATRDDPRVHAVATGLVLINASIPVTAGLTPAHARTAGASSHVVELTTQDPTGVLVTLRGTSPSPSATVTVDPVAVRVEPGRTATAQVTVRPRRAAVRRAREHPFEVVWETDGQEGLARGAVAGRLVQPPVVPPAVTVLLGVALALLLVYAAVTLWPHRPSGGTPVPSASAAAPSESGPPAGAGVQAPQVVVHTQFLDPRDADGSRTAAEARAAALRLPRGTRADVVDSSTVDWVGGFWLVVVRGFADRAAVADFCRTPPPGASTCSLLD